MRKWLIGMKSKKIIFDEYYRETHGQRWINLRSALEKEKQMQVLKSADGTQAYYLDQASLIAAANLEVGRGQKVLDLCAAPGGKSLYWLLKPELGSIQWKANEISMKRRLRLKRVLDQFLDREVRKRVEVVGHDARNWCLYEENAYDRILLDAPCSSEGHLIQQNQIASWSLAKVKRNMANQWAMLCSALAVLKSGGILVYSTCSINPGENEEQIERFLQSRSGQFEVLQGQSPIGKKLRWGWEIFPDIAIGAGPLYFCVMRKN